MAKSKKSDSVKVAKDKGLKALKDDKPGKGKKDKKKAGEAKSAVKPLAKAVKAARSILSKSAKAPQVTASQVTFTTEEIALRAYYIAERRQAMGWPGNETDDWIEAERQIKAESAQKSRS